MEIIFTLLLAAGAILALFFIFKLLTGCLIKVIVSVAVLVAAGLVVYPLLTG